MALTIKRIISGRVMFRIRPVIKIAQGNREILDLICSALGYGNVVSATQNCFAYQINGNKSIIRFVDDIAHLTHIKRNQLYLLKELSEFQDSNFPNRPYTYEAMVHMLDLRDKVFTANTWTRSRIMQKYSKTDVLKLHEFVDPVEWENNRREHLYNQRKRMGLKK